MSKVPSTGDIRFLSNANSVCQVFGLGTANVLMTSLDGKEVRKAQPDNSNWITATTISKPISLRNLAGGFVGTIAAPSVTVFGLYSGQDISLMYDPDSEDGTQFTYLAIGTTVGGSNILTYSKRGDFAWVGNANTGTSYYVSAFTSNIVTGEKGLLYVSGPITATNP